MKKRLFSLCLALILCLTLSFPALAEVNIELNTFIQPRYDAAKNFSADGYAAVKSDGKWGYIDMDGNWIVRPKYDWANSFSEGVAVAAKLYTVSGLPEGTLDSWSTDTYAYLFFLVYANGSEKLLYITPEYSYSLIFEGSVPLAWPQSSGSLDETGDAWFCQDGVVNVRGVPYTRDGRLITYSGSFAPRSSIDYMEMTGPCVNGVIPMRGSCKAMWPSSFQCFFMDTSGRLIHSFPAYLTDLEGRPPEGKGIYTVYAPRDGRIVAAQGGYENGFNQYTLTMGYTISWSYGAMDSSYNWIIPPEYDDCRYELTGVFFKEGLWTVSRDGKYGAVDAAGNTVIPLEYDFLSCCSEGLFSAVQNGRAFYLSRSGKVFQAGGEDGLAAGISLGGTFYGSLAAVFSAESGRAWCIVNLPEGDILPAVPGSASLGRSVYFPSYDPDTGEVGTLQRLDETVAIQINGKWGYARLNLSGLNPFYDVTASDYFYPAVVWAIARGVTTGTSETTFSPWLDCTRAQAMTFLWRATGSPAPSALGQQPFADVNPEDYYYRAVLWAVENGITQGTGDGLFSPDLTCSQAHILTFLWRLRQMPEAGSASSLAQSYSGQWYSGALAWADTTGLLTGMNGEFLPESMCPRADTVTYLYRCMA